jgi:hypothetical protein
MFSIIFVVCFIYNFSLETGLNNIQITKEDDSRSNDKSICRTRIQLQKIADQWIPLDAVLLLNNTTIIGRNWKWLLNLKSFEPVHGMSRVVLLVPDKLATAIAIFKEKLPDPDSGAFLVVLVIDLVKFYIDQVTNHQQQTSTPDTESADLQTLIETFGGLESDTLQNFPEEKADDFLQVLQNLSTKLESIQVSF